ncbi:MAG: hypothetical protein PHH98_01650 [Candidatus Gracilibacteria bacterium]|nr:hypothetical protein [Candidatus Gracilibacteria bacterium]
MKILKNVNLEILKKSIIGILLFIIFLYSGVFIYSYVFEQDKIAIDKYNFEQRDKVKSIIEKDKYYNIAFRDIKQFNSLYNSDIKPIKNCYDITKYNGDEKFLFGFKLESMIYKFKYFGENYAYPSNNLSKKSPCKNYGCISTREIFIDIISKPCE